VSDCVSRAGKIRFIAAAAIHVIRPETDALLAPSPRRDAAQSSDRETSGDLRMIDGR